jgi:hypothetical protein|tara:strand:+ start:169 stop:372 length:204 start_codon:yes stop_codon:yes gene_type:complete
MNIEPLPVSIAICPWCSAELDEGDPCIQVDEGRWACPECAQPAGGKKVETWIDEYEHPIDDVRTNRL